MRSWHSSSCRLDTKLCRRALVALFLVLLQAGGAVAQTQPAFTQSFQSEGPAPTLGFGGVVQSRDAPPNGTVSAAVTAVLPDPTSASSMFIGTDNGGVWVTRNGGASWSPLTDKQKSLSIASLAYNSSNSQVLYAGIGILSNGAIGVGADVQSRGGARTGILQSTDGGSTWNPLSDTVMAGLQNKSVVGVAGNTTAGQSVVLAATAEPQGTATGAAGYGLYRSVNGGNFALVGGLPSGAATSLVGKGTTGNPYYVAVTADTSANSGVFKSVDGGLNWTRALTTGTSQIGRLATVSGGAVAIALYDTSGSSKGQVTGVKLSQNGSDWTNLTFPQVNTGKQASTNLTIAIDPTNSKIVYLAGDTTTTGVTISAFRLTLQSDSSTLIQQITDAGTVNNSTIHADSRAFAFDADNRMILASDGGIYVRTNPRDDTGSWSGLNTGTLSIREPYSIAYDSISKRLLVAAQDTGAAYQDASRGPGYSPTQGGDGVNAAVNDKSLAGAGQSILYSSSQNFGNLSRTIVNAQGQTVSQSVLLAGPTALAPERNFDPADFTEDSVDPSQPRAKQLPFSSRMVLNRNDPGKIALGTNFLYLTTDALMADLGNTKPLTLIHAVDGLGNDTTLNGVSAIAYGTSNTSDALLVGAGNGLFYTTTPGGDSAGVLRKLTMYSGGQAVGVLFDPRSAQRFFAVDGASLYGTTDAGATAFSNFSTQLTGLSISRPNSLEFISNNGVNALLVGGVMSDPSVALSPIAVAKSDSGGTLTGWTWFGRGLPNTIVNQLVYNATADVLAVSEFGRGVWTLYDVTSYFIEAEVLRYGLADNDSAPDASFLIDGTGGARNLEKKGTGTLTIAGTAAYTGSTTVSDGTMLVTGSIASSSGLTIESAGTTRGTGVLPATTVNGVLWPGNGGIGTLTVRDALIFGGGGQYRIDATAQSASLTNVVAGKSGTGTMTLGGTVNLQLAAGNYVSRPTFTILNAAGGRTGTFASATSNYAFLQPTLSYDADNAYVTVAPGGFAQGAQTPNQAAVGRALDSGAAGASGDFANVVGAFSLLSADQAPGAFNQVSGQNYAAFGSAAVRSAQLFMANFSQQAGGGQTVGGGGGSGRIALAEACDSACDISGPRWGAWGGAFGGVGTLAGDANSSGVNFNIAGFSAGLDRRFGSSLQLGLTLGYSGSTQYLQTLSGVGTTNSVQGGLYGTYSIGNLYLDLLAGYARGDSRQVRPISVPGLATRTANGQTSANQFFGQFEGGYRFDLGGRFEPFVTPFAKLQGSSSYQAGFTETGADSLDLTVAGQSTNSLRSVIGGQFGGRIDMGWREKLGLVLRLGWGHEFADTTRPVTASFVGAPSSPFSVTGAAAPRDGALLGLAANTAIAASTSVYFRYDGELQGGNTSHIFSGGVRLVW